MTELLMKALMCAAVFTSILAPSKARSEGIRLMTLYWPPFIDKTNDGQIVGLGPTIVERILTDAGLDLKAELLPWPRIYKRATKKRNILVYSMVRFREREELFNWLSPLFISEPGVLVYNRDKPPPRPQTINALRRMKLCVTTGNTFYVKLRALGFEPGSNILEFETLFPDDDTRQQWYYVHPNCDFKVTNWAAVTSLLRQRGFKVPSKYIGFYPAPEQMLGQDMKAYLAASKNFDPKALDAIQRSSRKLLRSGALLSICRTQYQFDDKTCSMLAPQEQAER
ncbi:MAG: substrate-binding periplasmic protein [Hyphomicrobiaceae bacterium]